MDCSARFKVARKLLSRAMHAQSSWLSAGSDAVALCPMCSQSNAAVRWTVVSERFDFFALTYTCYYPNDTIIYEDVCIAWSTYSTRYTLHTLFPHRTLTPVSMDSLFYLSHLLEVVCLVLDMNYTLESDAHLEVDID